ALLVLVGVWRERRTRRGPGLWQRWRAWWKGGWQFSLKTLLIACVGLSLLLAAGVEVVRLRQCQQHVRVCNDRYFQVRPRFIEPVLALLEPLGLPRLRFNELEVPRDAQDPAWC